MNYFALTNTRDYILYLDDILIASHWLKNDYVVENIANAVKCINQNIDRFILRHTTQHVNHRNHAIHFYWQKDHDKLHKIIIYAEASDKRSAVSAVFREKDSVYHLIRDTDYCFILDVLLTPRELSHYLQFREILYLKNEHNKFSEQTILSQYLEANGDAELSLGEMMKNSGELTKKLEIMAHTLFLSTAQIFGWEHHTKNYYVILKQIAKLTLKELILFIEMFDQSCHMVGDKLSRLEYDSSCHDAGFVFIRHKIKDSNYEDHSARYKVIINGYQYQRQFPRCIAVLFFQHEGEKAEVKVSWWVHE